MGENKVFACVPVGCGGCLRRREVQTQATKILETTPRRHLKRPARYFAPPGAGLFLFVELVS